MVISMEKKEKLLLNSVGMVGLTNLRIGFRWNIVQKKSRGFFGKFFADDSEGVDLEASCLMFDENKKIIDTVSFRQLMSKDGSIIHSGDNLAADYDDDVIRVNLSKIPVGITSLVFVISSFHGKTFNEIESISCRLINEENNKELARYKILGKTNHITQIMARIYRENGNWTMQTLGESTNARTDLDLAEFSKVFI